MRKYVLLLLLVVSTVVYSKVETVYPIELIVVNEYNIDLGRKFGYELKENIRKSSFLRLTSEGPRLIMLVVTVPRFPETPENSIIFAVIWLFQPNEGLGYYLHSTAGFTGKHVYEETAKDLMRHIDGLIIMFKEWYEKQ